MLIYKTIEKTRGHETSIFSSEGLPCITPCKCLLVMLLYLRGTSTDGSCLASAWVADTSPWTSLIGGSDEHTYLNGNAPATSSC